MEIQGHPQHDHHSNSPIRPDVNFGLNIFRIERIEKYAEEEWLATVIVSDPTY